MFVCYSYEELHRIEKTDRHQPPKLFRPLFPTCEVTLEEDLDPDATPLEGCCDLFMTKEAFKEEDELPTYKLHPHATLESELEMDPVCLLPLEFFFSTHAALMDGQRKDATHSTIWLMPCPLLMNYTKLCPGDRSHMFIMKAAGVLDVP